MKKSGDRPAGGSDRAPFLNMRFRVEIEGLQLTGATEVVFPEARLEPSGRGRSVARYGPLILVRGLTRNVEWYEWWDRSRTARSPLKRAVLVTLLDERGADANRWEFSGAQPLAYTVSSLNSLGSDVLAESIELAVAGFRARFAA